NDALMHLLEEHRSQVAVVLSLSTLRRESAMINHTLSWEQTIEDFGAELTHFPRLQALSRFAHVFVRVGQEGVIHIQNVHDRITGEFYFTAYADAELHHDRTAEGATIGKNTILLAGLLGTIASRRKRKATSLDGWVKASIRAMIAADRYDEEKL